MFGGKRAQASFGKAFRPRTRQISVCQSRPPDGIIGTRTKATGGFSLSLFEKIRSLFGKKKAEPSVPIQPENKRLEKPCLKCGQPVLSMRTGNIYRITVKPAKGSSIKRKKTSSVRVLRGRLSASVSSAGNHSHSRVPSRIIRITAVIAEKGSRW